MVKLGAFRMTRPEVMHFATSSSSVTKLTDAEGGTVVVGDFDVIFKRVSLGVFA